MRERWEGRPSLVLVGFGERRRLAAIARSLGWDQPVLSDPGRALYAALGVGRAPVWRVYTPATVRRYVAALRTGSRLHRPDEDTRQLGADAVMVDGVVRALWRPRSPDDRPEATEVLAAATALDGG